MVKLIECHTNWSDSILLDLDKTTKAIFLCKCVEPQRHNLHAIGFIICSSSFADMPPEAFMRPADNDQGRLSEAGPSCKTQPVIMVFDSKPRYLRQNQSKKSMKSSAAASKKTFAFINISRTGKPDEESRRLVKTHAMQDVLRRKSGESSKLAAKFPKSLCISQDSPRSMESSPQAPPSCLLAFPIPTEPYMLKLVHDCV